MINVGVVISSLSGPNKYRGIGVYANNLLKHLKANQERFGVVIHKITAKDIRKTNSLDIIHYLHINLFNDNLITNDSSKTIVTIHDVIPLEFKEIYKPGLIGKINSKILINNLKKADTIITDSIASVNNIIKYLNISHDRIRMIYLGSSDEIFYEDTLMGSLKKKYNIPNKYILYVGDINYNKNLPNLSKACSKIGIPLLIIGKEAARIEQIDKNHSETRHLLDINLSSTIRLGYLSVEELRNIYSCAFKYCQPSLSEGFGLPILEAMNCYAPLCLSDIPVHHEIAKDAACYFNPHSINDLMNCLSSSQKVDRKLYRQISDNFSWEKCAIDTLNLYVEKYNY